MHGFLFLKMAFGVVDIYECVQFDVDPTKR